MGVVTIGCANDNQGNHFVLDSLMSTRYPLGPILIELSYGLAGRRMALRAEWVPCLQKEEADALTDGETRHFTAMLFIDVKIEEVKFGVLTEVLAAIELYFAELEAARAKAKSLRVQGLGVPNK